MLYTNKQITSYLLELWSGVILLKKKIKLNVFGAISFAESMLIDSSLIVIFII